MKNQAFVKLVNEANEAYIDIDTYGITLTRGWREALLAPPPVKNYISNDSRLENGVAIVATAKYVRQDKRDINLSFFLEGISEEDYLDKYERFLEKIAYNGEFCLKVPCLKRVYKLVYTQCSKYGDYGLKKSNFTLKLTENNPNDREKL
mgnify:FL=1